MAYTTDADLVEIRPNIMSLGVDEWSSQHDDATQIINEILEVRWYRQQAIERELDYSVTTFDGTKLDSTQIKRLACYKTLELCYEHLMKGAAVEDGFERFMKLYQERFNAELQRLLVLGIHYDWDDSDTIEQTEKFGRGFRQLSRS